MNQHQVLLCLSYNPKKNDEITRLGEKSLTGLFFPCFIHRLLNGILSTPVG